MKNNRSMAKVGSFCSIAVGIVYVGLGILFFLLPVAHRPGSGLSEAEFFATGSQDFTLLLWEMRVIALSAVLVVGVVLAVSELMRPANAGLVRYTGTLAIIGLAVISMTYTLDQWHTPQMLEGYQNLDQSGKAVLDIIGTRHFDPQGIFGFGMVGLWLLVVNWTAIKGGQFPRGLAYLGLALGIGYWCVVAGRLLSIPQLIAIAAALGAGIIAPIWYIGMGLSLRKQRPADQ
jgi:hypothetical protein